MLFVFNNLTHIQKQECIYIGFFKYLALHKSTSFSQRRKGKIEKNIFWKKKNNLKNILKEAMLIFYPVNLFHP